MNMRAEIGETIKSAAFGKVFKAAEKKLFIETAKKLQALNARIAYRIELDNNNQFAGGIITAEIQHRTVTE